MKRTVLVVLLAVFVVALGWREHAHSCPTLIEQRNTLDAQITQLRKQYHLDTFHGSQIIPADLTPTLRRLGRQREEVVRELAFYHCDNK